MAMTKWWGKKRHAEAEVRGFYVDVGMLRNIFNNYYVYLLNEQVTMHVSPYLLNTISPWIPTFPKKVVDRFATWLWPIGTAAGTYYVLSWADHEDHKEQYNHRY